ncbi:MAG: hypothetical protein A2Y62_13145 [Candidatus Fischerbacteria bacterium RBG_13_37_8]|uniref:NapC/NirT cytochrome c N-terminal domain-containing protein n=1 Tax=Candidatus Fischerbacteria bacterium RBG_13_37_8 TaxID=1817863 RepID=A0A1F5V5M0_9BACT|nr:MAG: hypothetical protein A2Y62_13145 [Candidatus Fischerbacteria bacterium RBG_13_37_8]
MIKIRSVSFILILLIAFGFLFIVFTMQMTSTPRFCGTCHIMEPYYRSWQTSSHRAVACVECHIPPGITSEFQKKYEALSMLVKYVTATYGTNPWTEIEDESCLKCHERRLLVGTELFQNVLFDHRVHLTEMKRGKKLRCTSCHSQIVQGSHIAVTESTCFICHFKDQKFNEASARCTLCHEIPDKVMTRSNLAFNHAEVKKYAMKCEWCHASVIRGDGIVLKERCYTCHNDPVRLNEFNNIERLHQAHVTEHKVECNQCHLEIIHKSDERLELAAPPCAKCHFESHSYQRDLYVGIAGKEVHPRPSIMYHAGVGCEGCHFLPSKKGAAVANANEISCMACHGASFRKIYFTWKNYLQDLMAQTEKVYTAALSKVNRNNEYMQEADANLKMVKQGIGIHNVEYSSDLLNETIELVNKALEQEGKQKSPLNPEKIPYDVPCWGCHLGIQKAKVTALGNDFSHKIHVFSNKTVCFECHNQHEPDKFKMPVTFKKEGCASCHHKTEKPDKCKRCHAGIKSPIMLGKDGIPAVLKFKAGTEFNHSMHIDDLGLNCFDCHGIKTADDAKMQLLVQKCKDCHE